MDVLTGKRTDLGYLRRLSYTVICIIQLLYPLELQTNGMYPV